MSRTKSRRIRVREIISRARTHVDDENCFSTHEMKERIQDMKPEDLKGIPFAASVVRHLERADTLAMFLRGHGDVTKHELGCINISVHGQGRVRSQIWTFN